MYLRQVAAALAGALVLAGASRRMRRPSDATGTMTAAAAGDRDWVELGCQKVSFRAERDVIRVGRREGRFTAIPAVCARRRRARCWTSR